MNALSGYRAWHYMRDDCQFARVVDASVGVTHYTSPPKKRWGSDGSGHAPLCACVVSLPQEEVPI